MIYMVALCLTNMSVEILEIDPEKAEKQDKLKRTKPLKSFNTETEAQNFREVFIRTHDNLHLNQA